MRLTDEERLALEILSQDQVRAIKSLLALTGRYFEDCVLKCSLGDRGDLEQERKLVVAKYRHEGAMRLETLFSNELQNLRKLARTKPE